jgi:hypothetical protein
MRCRNTCGAISTISSGVTKSRPFIAALALADFKIANDALGDAPKYSEGLLRVSFTIRAINSI